MTYKTGYRRPPRESQFKKGHSGNPSGRPKGSRNLLTILDQELSQTISVVEKGRKKRITRMQAIVKRMVTDALQGNQRAQLALVEIARKREQSGHGPVDSLVPDNFSEIVEAFVAKRQRSSGERS